MARKARVPIMTAQLRKSSLAIATILFAIGSIAPLDIAAADASTETASCSVNGDDATAGGFSSTTCEQQPGEPSVKPNESDNDYSANCYIWPTDGVPLEHTNEACNRALQNAELAARHAEAESTPPENLIPDEVYLNLPEEKSWICPLDMDSGVDANAGKIKYTMMSNNGPGAMLGHRTKWVLHNRASNPIIVSHVNALGLEVAANDFSTYPAHSNTAVYPHGPIVLPGTMAVIEGRMGQTFVAREYREVMPLEVMQGIENEGGEHLHHSWKSFKNVLPPTLSFLPEKTRYTTNKGVMHVLGRSGRALIKHRMGNIYIKNESGAVCPQAMGLSGLEDKDDGRRGNPQDMDPDCNVLRKAFINKVGCPIDIYFSPANKVEGYNCEKFTKHLGSLDSFLASSPDTRDLDSHDSPLKFENSYNGHNFVARMSHDQSLVARIELDHDIVRDCPEPKKSSASVEVLVDERILRGVTEDIMTINATTAKSSLYASSGEWVSTKVNVTASTLPVKVRDEKHDLLWHNRTGGIMSTSTPIAS